MCGRYSLKASPDELKQVLDVLPPPGYRPRFNIAPMQDVLALVPGGDGCRWTPCLLRWGLVPFWADDPSVGNRMINARAETVARKPAYRNAFSRRRCLLVADGFYEWQRRPEGKRPMRVRLRSDAPFLLAGLWERWDRRGTPLETCTILTTRPSSLMAPIHDRMPVVLDRSVGSRWLAADASADELLSLLRPYEGDDLEAYEVSTLVNNPAHDAAECLAPVA